MAQFLQCDSLYEQLLPLRNKPSSLQLKIKPVGVISYVGLSQRCLELNGISRQC
jgi:hypothetical protein